MDLVSASFFVTNLSIFITTSYQQHYTLRSHRASARTNTLHSLRSIDRTREYAAVSSLLSNGRASPPSSSR